MQELKNYIVEIFNNTVEKAVISNPIFKSGEYKKITVERKTGGYQISKYTEKQVFHENVSFESVADSVFALVYNSFRQLNAWSRGSEHTILISKKGACKYLKKTSDRSLASTEDHNRKKNYILKEGESIPPLVDMGVFTAEGHIVKAMYNKYKQINRFLEIIDDEISKKSIEHLNVIDFGCGKSYLTFILYHYLSNVKNISVNIIGLDLKADVIEKCNLSAKKYNYTNLKFELGDINGYKAPFEVDMVISLHACDTATDYAIYNAISWNAKYIFSVPCCQHELNSQINPKTLNLISRYGIIQERFSALATDAIRGNLLEYCGYKTQILEFIDLDHTPKNILIRAVKRAETTTTHREKALEEIKNLVSEFGFQPKLCQLLKIR